MARRKEIAPETVGGDTDTTVTPASEADTSFNTAEFDAPEEKRAFNPIRSWSERSAQPVKYQKLTDANMFVPGASQRGAIIFKFELPRGQYKPDSEVLEVMQSNKKGYQDKPTGLRFTQTREHGAAWVLPNDMEGRTLADKIEQGLKEVAEKMEAETRIR